MIHIESCTAGYSVCVYLVYRAQTTKVCKLLLVDDDRHRINHTFSYALYEWCSWSLCGQKTVYGTINSNQVQSAYNIIILYIYTCLIVPIKYIVYYYYHISKYKRSVRILILYVNLAYEPTRVVLTHYTNVIQPLSSH